MNIHNKLITITGNQAAKIDTALHNKNINFNLLRLYTPPHKYPPMIHIITPEKNIFCIDVRHLERNKNNSVSMKKLGKTMEYYPIVFNGRRGLNEAILGSHSKRVSLKFHFDPRSGYFVVTSMLEANNIALEHCLNVFEKESQLPYLKQDDYIMKGVFGLEVDRNKKVRKTINIAATPLPLQLLQNKKEKIEIINPKPLYYNLALSLIKLGYKRETKIHDYPGVLRKYDNYLNNRSVKTLGDIFDKFLKYRF